MLNIPRPIKDVKNLKLLSINSILNPAASNSAPNNLFIDRMNTSKRKAKISS